MSAGWRRAVRNYVRLLGLLVVIAAALLMLGWVPTRKLGGPEGITAMVAGCGLSLAGSAIGALPIFWAERRERVPGPSSILASVALRFVLVLAAAAAVALSGVVERVAFVVWVGVSYLAFLVADVRHALVGQKAS